MKRYLITAGLLFGLAGLSASAQTTPNTDPNQPQAGTQSTPPTFPSDQQSSSPSQDPAAATQSPTTSMPDSTDRTNRGQADADQTTSSPTSGQSGTTSSGQGSMSSSQTQPGQTGSSTSGSSATGGSATAGSDAQSQIQAALQQQGLSSVQTNVSADSIELTGTVETGKQKKEAKKIAESYAGGLKVVDHLKVTGKGEAKQENQ